MNQSVIVQLNQLNQEFYKITAQSFSDSRNYYWQGWQTILPILKTLANKNLKLKILDLGCGNGRFANFLKENLDNDFSYLGLDSSTELLEIASEKFKKISFLEKITFKKIDLIQNLLADKPIVSGKFEAIVLFGVLHHLPSFKLRQKLLINLGQLLATKGILIVTAWQFLDNPKLKSRLINPVQIGLNKNDLEKNDFILDWQRDQLSFVNSQKPLRYCHLTSNEEILALLQNSTLEIVKKFVADSKTKNLNQYYILQKKE